MCLFQGEFKPIGDPRSTAPFVPAALPAFAEVDKMVYIWLTDYVFNTAGFVYHQQGALRTVITPKDVRIRSVYTKLKSSQTPLAKNEIKYSNTT